MHVALEQLLDPRRVHRNEFLRERKDVAHPHADELVASGLEITLDFLELVVRLLCLQRSDELSWINVFGHVDRQFP